MVAADGAEFELSGSGGMAMVCAWCKNSMRDGPGEISHGICVDCSDKMNTEIDAESLVM